MTEMEVAEPRHPARWETAQVALNAPLNDLDEAMRIADIVSKSDLVPTSLFGKPASVLHVILTGQAMGIHWTEALRLIYSPGRGQIGMRGQLLLTKLRKAGHSYNKQEGDGYCKFWVDRGDTEEHFEAEFTIEDAIQAKLCRREEDGTIVALSSQGNALPWQMWTKRMLMWRAVSECVSFAAPEVMMGFGIEGAMDDRPDEGPPEVKLTPAAPDTAPAQADAGQAHSSGDPAQQDPAAELADLDAKMRGKDDQQEHPFGTSAPAATAESAAAAAGTGSTREAGSSAAAPPAKPTQADMDALGGHTGDGPGSAAARAKGQVLAEQFTRMGWPPAQYRADVMKACSALLRRRVLTVRNMTAAEMSRVADALIRIQRRTPQDGWLIALADAIEGWRQEWAAEDPAGYDSYRKDSSS